MKTLRGWFLYLGVMVATFGALFYIVALLD